MASPLIPNSSAQKLPYQGSDWPDKSDLFPCLNDIMYRNHLPDRAWRLLRDPRAWPVDRHVLHKPSASIVAALTLNPASFAARASTADRSWSSISTTLPHSRQIRNCAAWVW